MQRIVNTGSALVEDYSATPQTVALKILSNINSVKIKQGSRMTITGIYSTQTDTGYTSIDWSDGLGNGGNLAYNNSPIFTSFNVTLPTKIDLGSMEVTITCYDEVFGSIVLNIATVTYWEPSVSA